MLTLIIIRQYKIMIFFFKSIIWYCLIKICKSACTEYLHCFTLSKISLLLNLSCVLIVFLNTHNHLCFRCCFSTKTNQNRNKQTTDKPKARQTLGVWNSEVTQYFSTPSPTTTFSSPSTLTSMDDMLMSVFRVDLDSLFSTSAFSLSS